MKAYQGKIKNIRFGISRHNHLIISGISVGHPVYNNVLMHTSGVEHICFHIKENYAEIETHNSIYNIEDNETKDYLRLLSLDKSIFKDLIIETV